MIHTQRKRNTNGTVCDMKSADTTIYWSFTTCPACLRQGVQEHGVGSGPHAALSELVGDYARDTHASGGYNTSVSDGVWCGALNTQPRSESWDAITCEACLVACVRSNVFKSDTVVDRLDDVRAIRLQLIESKLPSASKVPAEKCRRCGGPAMALFTTVECSRGCR